MIRDCAPLPLRTIFVPVPSRSREGEPLASGFQPTITDSAGGSNNAAMQGHEARLTGGQSAAYPDLLSSFSISRSEMGQM